MPKTRSGKIMRRVIAAISNFADVGDTTTLSNPEIVDDIRHHVQGEKVARGDVPPRALTPRTRRDRSLRQRRIAVQSGTTGSSAVGDVSELFEAEPDGSVLSVWVRPRARLPGGSGSRLHRLQQRVDDAARP
jgi:hypothetical protein